MKKITLRADDDLVEAAQVGAQAGHKTLDRRFGKGLAEYARRQSSAIAAVMLIKELQWVARTGGRKFTRDEMNAR